MAGLRCLRVVLGIVANAATTALAAAAYGAAAVAALRRQRQLGLPASAAPVLFGAIAAYLALAALRQVAAALATRDASWTDVDRGIYLAVIVPAALVIVPHVYLVSLVRWGSPRRSRILAAAFFAVVLVGLAFAYLGGVEGPVESDYGTDWTLQSPVTKVLLLVAIMLPGLLGSGALVWMARGSDSVGRRRVGLIGWAGLVYFGVFTLDAFGLSGLALLAARLATAGTGIAVWIAYRPREKTYSPPPEAPDDAVYET